MKCIELLSSKTLSSKTIKYRLFFENSSRYKLPVVTIIFRLKSQQRPTRKVFFYKIQVNPIHTILKYGDYYDFMDR